MIFGWSKVHKDITFVHSRLLASSMFLDMSLKREPVGVVVKASAKNQESRRS